MKKSILTVIIAGALAGCSSNGSNNDGPTPEPKEGIADVIYNEELHSAVITGDQGNSAAIIGDGNGNAAIKINDQAFTVQGDVIVNDQGEIVGTVTTEDGVAIANVNGISYTLSVSNGRLIVDKDKLKPEYDEPRPETTPPTYGDIIAAGGAVIIKGDNDNFVTIKADGQGNAGIVINGGEQTYVVKDGELFNYETGESVGHIQKDGENYTVRLDNGTEVVFRNDDGRLFAAVISRPDISNPIIDDHRPETTPPTYGDIVAAGGAVIIKGDNDNFVTIKADGQGNAGIVINGGEQTYVMKDGELFNYETGESVGHIQKDGENYTVRLDNGTEVVFRNDDGRLFAAVISRPDADNGKKLAYTVLAEDQHGKVSILEHNGSEASVLIHRDYDEIDRSTVTITDRNGNIVEFDHAQMAAAKAQAKALSSEQRQQIKQTIKTKLQTRS